MTFHRAAYFLGRKTTAARPETQKSIGSVAYFVETHVKVAAVDTMGSTPATRTAPQIGRLAKSAAHTTVTCKKRLVVCRSVGQRANQLHHTPVSSHETSSNKDGFKFKSDSPTWPRMCPLRRACSQWNKRGRTLTYNDVASRLFITGTTLVFLSLLGRNGRRLAEVRE